MARRGGSAGRRITKRLNRAELPGRPGSVGRPKVYVVNNSHPVVKVQNMDNETSRYESLHRGRGLMSVKPSPPGCLAKTTLMMSHRSRCFITRDYLLRRRPSIWRPELPLDSAPRPRVKNSDSLSSVLSLSLCHLPPAPRFHFSSSRRNVNVGARKV